MKPLSKKDEYALTAIAKYKAAMSETNRASMSQWLDMRLNDKAIASVKSDALALKHADDFFRGRSLAEVTPAEWVAFNASLRARFEDSTRALYLTELRRYLKDVHDLDKLPRALGQALKVPSSGSPESGQVIDADWFYRLLATCESRYTNRKHKSRFPAVPMFIALLWFLWDSGMRVSEALGLNVGDVQFDEHGSAMARMRKDQPGLKTGPRPVPLTECVAALKVWLAVHPQGPDRNAPLFCGTRSKGLRYLAYDRVYDLVVDLSDASGWTAEHTLGHLSPHDFRHTRCTRAAQANWGQQRMEDVFGWEPGSPMPSHYSHLSDEDLLKQARQDVGMDSLGYKEALDAGQKDAAFWMLLREKLGEDVAQRLRTTKPPEWRRP
ncbi:MAG: tyrosine-type recombinase/integrase [Thermoplasmatota archaeon]